jgi:hypothetical protein
VNGVQIGQNGRTLKLDKRDTIRIQSRHQIEVGVGFVGSSCAAATSCTLGGYAPLHIMQLSVIMPLA